MDCLRILIFIYILLLLEGQTDEAWEPSKSSAVSEIGEHWIEKYFHIFVACKGVEAKLPQDLSEQILRPPF